MAGTSKQAVRKAQVRCDGHVLVCSGDWSVRHLEAVQPNFTGLRIPDGSLCLDLSQVEHMDTGGAWTLNRLIALLEQSHPLELRGLSTQSKRLLDLVRGGEALATRDLAAAPRQGVLERLGRRACEVASSTRLLLAFIGELGFAWGRQFRHPSRIRWRQVADELAEAGHRALGIVGLLAFLLGIVIAYQGGVQLRQYGASLFVADLVGLSMVRELAPMITAIIVAGRTGSAYTAQIGTMKVTEEVDALRSIGIPPLDLLVLPKLLALVIALPLLTVFADIMGILGGMLMSSLQLEIAFSTFLERIGIAISTQSFLVGIGKAPVFAVVIATIGCYQGFRVTGSAESVGRRTTASVVQAILAVIVIDAAFSVAFSWLGI